MVDALAIGTTCTHGLDVRGGVRSGVIPGSRPRSATNAEWCADGATGGGCLWLQSSARGLPAPPESS